MCGLLFLLFRNTVVMSGDRRVVTGGRKQNGTEAGRNRRRIDRMLMQTHTHTHRLRAVQTEVKRSAPLRRGLSRCKSPVHTVQVYIPYCAPTHIQQVC